MTKSKYTEEEAKGKIFGYLVLLEKTVEKLPSNQYKKTYWTCKCICGKIVKRLQYEIFSGATYSCGCQPRNRGKPPLN